MNGLVCTVFLFQLTLAVVTDVPGCSVVNTEDNKEYQFYTVKGESLSFKVRAAHDARIALTTQPTGGNPIYEIFIGGWKNTKTSIRKNDDRKGQSLVETLDILNATEYRSFWLRWSGGVVAIGKDGESEPIVRFNDPESFIIFYFGISTAWGANGSWIIQDIMDMSNWEVREFTVFETSAEGMMLKWLAPSAVEECVASYRVVLCSERTLKCVVYDFPPSVTNSYLVSNLTCFKVGKIRVTAVDKAGKQANTSTNIQYSSDARVPERVERFSIISTSPMSIKVRWAKENSRACASSYLLTLRDDQVGWTENYRIPLNTTEYTFTHLQPCVRYTASILVEGHEAGDSEVVKASTQTEVAETSSVVNLTVLKKSEDQIHLEWKRPTLNEACVVSYGINYYQAGGKHHQVRSQITSAVVTGLMPCGEYFIEVFPILTDRTVGPEAKLQVSTLYAEPGPITQLSATRMTNYYLTLSWTPPPHTRFCLSGYNLTWSLNGQIWQQVNNNNIALPAQSTQFNLAAELLPCRRYDLMLTPLNMAGRPGKTVHAYLQIPSNEIGAITISSLTSNADGISVEWESPYVTASCVDQYIVKYAIVNSTTPPKTLNINANSNLLHYSVTLTELMPCSEYSITIFGVNERQQSGAATSVKQATKPIVSLVPVEGAMLNVGSDWAELSWRLLEHDKCPPYHIEIACSSYSGAVMLESHIVPFSGDDQSVTYNVTNLSPNTKYVCYAIIKNAAGPSALSEQLIITTNEGAPSEPRNVTVSKVTSHSLLVMWQEPTFKPGILNSYKVTAKGVGLTYWVPPGCLVFPSPQLVVTTSAVKTNLHIDKLKPGEQIELTVAAKTGSGGYGNTSATVFVSMLPDVSGSVRDLNVSLGREQTILSWLPPCDSHGVLTHYHLELSGRRKGYPDIRGPPWEVPVKPDQDASPLMYDVVLTSIRAEYNYQITVEPIVKSVEEHGEVQTYTFTSPAQIPPNVSDALFKAISIDVKNTEAVLSLRSDLFSGDNGEIVYYALLVGTAGWQELAHTGWLASPQTWPQVKNWAAASTGPDVVVYQTTPKWWNPFADRRQVISYTIGSDTTCQLSDANITDYCNGPLRPNTEYQMCVRAFTCVAFKDTPVIIFTTGSNTPVKFIVAIILGLVLVPISGAVFFLYISGRLPWIVRKVVSDEKETVVKDVARPRPSVVSVKQLSLHCHRLLESDIELKREFEMLNTLSNDCVTTTNVALLPHNRKKNRYINILPFDYSRAVLEGEPESDYINASFIKLEDGKREYIACQGPKEDTCEDFWRMVHQFNVHIIVMLCELVEQDKEKCYQYYPDPAAEELQFGEIKIENLTIRPHQGHLIRTLRLTKLGVNRTIQHLHFTEWPDFGVPMTAEAMLQFVHSTRVQSALAPAGPLLIHCSAGVGRTGTFIAVDTLVHQILNKKKISVFDTVLKLRQQRMNMVQTEAQYAYIYTCLKYQIEQKTRKNSNWLKRSTTFQD